ncbi:hypothetical protein Droror1_Dr00022982 [Drosera rotundifolia]
MYNSACHMNLRKQKSKVHQPKSEQCHSPATILSAQDEITRKVEELIHLRELLFVTMKDAKCEKLTLENFSLEQELQNHQQNQQLLQKQHKAASITRGMSAEDKCKAGDTNTSFSCSDTEESIVSSPGNTEVIHPQNISTSPSYLSSHITLNLANKRPLPEKGKLLKAVMEAGPLLQTLLLAGQLPKWQHPPPRLDSIEIPPVRISSSVHGESSKKLLLIFLTARLPHPAASMKAWVDIEYCKASKRKSATNYDNII